MDSGTIQKMTTVELIRELRAWAGKMIMPGRRSLVNEAADRLEALDERVAIMEEGNQVILWDEGGMTVHSMIQVLDALGMEMTITKKADGEGLAANDAGING